MWSFFASLILGLAVGYRVPLSKRAVRWAGHGTTLGLLVLLFTMGIKIGMNSEIFENLQTIGLRASVLALSAVVGSLLLLLMWERKFPFSVSEEGDEG